MKRAWKYQLCGVFIILLGSLFTSLDDAGISGISGRIATVQSIGERGVFYIDNSSFRSVDKVTFEQHVYSDKPPLAQWIFGVVYRTARSFGAPEFAAEKAKALYWLNVFFGMTVNSLIFLWLFNALRRSGIRGRQEVKFLLSLLAVSGSWLFSYATIFNNHNLTALALLGLLVSLQKMHKKPTLMAAFAAGISAGFAGNFEIPAGIFAGFAAVAAAAWGAPEKRKLSFFSAAMGGGILMLSLFFMLNYYGTGSWRPLYIVSGGTYSVPELVRHDSLKYIFDIFIGPRGIFSYQPFLLLAPVYMIWRWKRLANVFKVLLCATWLLMIFYIFFTNEYGGWGYGFRYYIQVIPVLWFFAGCLVLETLTRGGKMWKVPLFALLLAVGIITASVGTFSPYCVAYEAYRTPKGHFTETIQSTFSGNLLALLYLHAPESRLFAAMTGYYGKDAVQKYIFWALINRNIPDEKLGISGRNETLKRIFSK